MDAAHLTLCGGAAAAAVMRRHKLSLGVFAGEHSRSTLDTISFVISLSHMSVSPLFSFVCGPAVRVCLRVCVCVSRFCVPFPSHSPHHTHALRTYSISEAIPRQNSTELFFFFWLEARELRRGKRRIRRESSEHTNVQARPPPQRNNRRQQA